MDEALRKSGDYPNIAITPGTHRHAATGEPVEIPEWARMDYMQPREPSVSVLQEWGTGQDSYILELFERIADVEVMEE